MAVPRRRIDLLPLRKMSIRPAMVIASGSDGTQGRIFRQNVSRG